jgi:histidinol-phosphate aminotransferase
MKSSISDLFRDSIREFYRNEIDYLEKPEPEKEIRLHANENSNGTITGAFYNRYPDPQHKLLRQKWAETLSISSENIIAGNGNEEIIDWLLELFIEPYQDTIVYVAPMVNSFIKRAKLHGGVLKPLEHNINENIIADKILSVLTPDVKMFFLMNPNNPTGKAITFETISRIARHFKGIIVIDESYYDFVIPNKTIGGNENIIAIRNLDHSWGGASLQLSAIVADETIINTIKRIKHTYNLNGVVQSLSLQLLNNAHGLKNWVENTNRHREKLTRELIACPKILSVYPSEANFLLVKIEDSQRALKKLQDSNIMVADMGHLPFCEGCIRITVGNAIENKKLVDVLETL